MKTVPTARLATVPRYAAQVATELDGAADSVFLVRLARQVLQDATHVSDPAGRRAFLEAPRRLGHPVWQAFTAALAAYTAHSVFGQSEPPWTNNPESFLVLPQSPFSNLAPDRLWWDWINTAPEFAHRKVILHRSELEWI